MPGKRAGGKPFAVKASSCPASDAGGHDRGIRTNPGRREGPTISRRQAPPVGDSAMTALYRDLNLS